MQVHLLVRALGLSIADAAGPEAAAEVLEAEMEGTCWVMSERLARLLDLPLERAGLDAIETILALHPAFQPAEYQPISIERQGDVLRLVLLEGPADDDADGASWSALLRRGRLRGLEALVHAVDRQAVVTPVPGNRPAWTISVDRDATPVDTPDWANIGHLSGSSSFQFEQRVTLGSASGR